ncbi:DUF2793 domain-containing protein [Paenirhodobacter populi]|uniref:DUF2793 domain-containing protein n=1 Tax=Paenirhodobacter populi TaxID=2306993 RepID=UPI0013E30031|nr:DUF2793 domain-containing protein [Sinirhodobacter populi]
MATSRLGLPFVAEGQAQPHVTHNEAMDMLDAAFPQIASSATETAAPVNPAEGAAYILPPGAWGFGAVEPGQIALRHGGIWHAITPVPGWRWFVLDEGAARVFDGTAWRPGDVVGAQGGRLGLGAFDAVVDLSGASVSVADLLPARAIILGVSSWVVEAVTGAASYSVGMAGDLSKFGGSLGLAAGSSNVGVVGPFATYSPDAVVVTASGGAFSGGRLGLSVAAIVPGVPV